MYDYATVTKQNQIISLISDFNTNVITLAQSIYIILVVISVILALIFLKSLVSTCLGGKR